MGDGDGDGDLDVRDGDGDAEAECEVRRDLEGDGDTETDETDADGEVGTSDTGGDGSAMTAAGAIGPVEDGSTTVGVAAEAAGPTARNATQMTSPTMTATAKTKTVRAGLIDELCFEGNGPGSLHGAGAQEEYLFSPCLWNDGPSIG